MTYSLLLVFLHLDFIKKYALRFGVAPAESDIERHVLVSAPSVNQMIQTLERAGLSHANAILRPDAA